MKDELTQEQRDVNNKFNYSDEIKDLFRQSWSELYTPIIDRIFAKVHPYTAFARATINLHHELVTNRDAELEKMLFDGQATVRTFDAFREGLARRVGDREPNWDTPEIKETLDRVNAVMNGRKEMVERMKENRALFLLDNLTGPIKKKAFPDGVVAKPLRQAVDRLFENVFSTVAFQTADRADCRVAVAQSLMRRRVADYCNENRRTEAELDDKTRAEIRNKAKANYEEFLTALIGRKVSLDASIFDPTPGAPTLDAAASAEEAGEVADNES